MILFGGRSLRRAMKEYIAHYHTERNHQGKNNLLLFHRISTKASVSEPLFLFLIALFDSSDLQ
jgi:hypothetical protein